MDELKYETAEWRTATASGDNGQCVQVATNLSGRVLVRDSKNPNGPVLIFTPGEWAAFLDGAGKGEFDI